MKMSRSLLQQIIAYNMPFAFLILFTLGTIVDGNISTKSSQNTNPTDATSTPLYSTTSVGAKQDESTAPQDTTALSTGPELIPTTNDNEQTNVTAKRTPLVSGQKAEETKASVSPTPTMAPVSLNTTSTERETIAATSASSTPPSHVIIPAKETTRKTDIGKGPDSADGVTEKPGQASHGTNGTVKETGPGQTTETTDTPGHGAVTTHDTDRRPPLLSTTGSTTTAPGTGSSGATSSRKNYIGVVLAIVFCVLALLALLAFLYVRWRKRSGSTDIAKDWAGKAALPDDAALDKDVEQGEVNAGEGEAKRNTLVTFFGKRPSRVPSVVMEDMSGKGEREETEQLLDKGAGGDANLEGTEEANGKLKETTMPSPREASASSKAGGGSSS